MRSSVTGVVRSLQTIISVQDAAARTDRELLQRFVDSRDPIAFEAIVQRHQAAVESARRITDGLVRTIAAVVAERRKPPTGYGPQAHAAPADARAIALNRKA